MVGRSFAIRFVLDCGVWQAEYYHFRTGQVDVVARRIAVEHLDRNPRLGVCSDFIDDSGELPELLAFKSLGSEVVAVGRIRPLRTFNSGIKAHPLRVEFNHEHPFQFHTGRKVQVFIARRQRSALHAFLVETSAAGTGVHAGNAIAVEAKTSSYAVLTVEAIAAEIEDVLPALEAVFTENVHSPILIFIPDSLFT